MSRRTSTKKNLITFGTLAVAAAIVIVATVLAQQWWNNRPGPDPATLTVTASTPSGEVSARPYQVCVLGEDCPEGQVTVVDLGPKESMTVTVPKSVAQHNWMMLKIYTDPAANSEQYFRPGETDTVTVPGSAPAMESTVPTTTPPSTEASAAPTAPAGQAPRLLVVEIHAVVIGTDDKGEQAPTSVVWSLSTKKPGTP